MPHFLLRLANRNPKAKDGLRSKTVTFRSQNGIKRYDESIRQRIDGLVRPNVTRVPQPNSNPYADCRHKRPRDANYLFCGQITKSPCHTYVPPLP